MSLSHVFLLLILLLSTPIVQANIDGKLTDIIWPAKGIYDPSEDVPFHANVTNTGSEEHVFWVGYSVQDLGGRWWNQLELAQPTAPIKPNENCSVKLSWSPRNDALRGSYAAELTLWSDWSSEKPINEMDHAIKHDAFRLNSSSKFNVDTVQPGFKEDNITIYEW